MIQNIMSYDIEYIQKYHYIKSSELHFLELFLYSSKVHKLIIIVILLIDRFRNLSNQNCFCIVIY